MSLRTILILIGLAIVVAVWAATAYRRRRETRLRFDRHFSRLDLPDVILEHEDEELDADRPARPRRSVTGVAASSRPAGEPRLPEELQTPTAAHEAVELPLVRNDVLPAHEPAHLRKRSDQMDLFGAAASAPDEPAGSRARREPAPEPASGLVTVFVRAPSAHPFNGGALVRALNAVGMQFGEKSIFHHFGAGEMKCASAVFSAANMFEPGTFDLTRIEAFRTTGVALFLQLPGPLDGPVAFELLLNTAQRLCELTGGELCSDPRTPLDSATIARLRKRVARFGHVRA